MQMSCCLFEYVYSEYVDPSPIVRVLYSTSPFFSGTITLEMWKQKS